MIHAITDGRDTSPTGGADYLATVSAQTGATRRAKIATVIGRYYAMDRDKRWERNKLAWDAIVLGRGAQFGSSRRPRRWPKPIRASRGATNFWSRSFSPIANEQRIRDGDVVLWFNFRADRARQLSIAFLRQGLQRLRPRGHSRRCIT